MSADLEMKKTNAEYSRYAEILAQHLLAMKTKEELASMLALEIITKEIEADYKALYGPKLAEMRKNTERIEAETVRMLSTYLDKYFVVQGNLTEVHARNKSKAMRAARESAHRRSEVIGKEQVINEYFTRRGTGHFEKRGAKTAFDKEMAAKHGVEPKTVEGWRLEIQRFIDSSPDEQIVQ